jgi:hypothetical protein
LASSPLASSSPSLFLYYLVKWNYKVSFSQVFYFCL